MQRFWVLVLWILWVSIGCSKDVPVEDLPFFDSEGKRIPLFVSAPGIKDGVIQLEPGRIREIKFNPPLQVGAGSNRVQLQITRYNGRIWIEFFGPKDQYSMELPAPLTEGGSYTFALPPSRYEGFRIRGQEGKETQEIVVQEGRVGNFALHTRFEEGRFLEIASVVFPEYLEKGTVVFRLAPGTDPSPSRGLRLQLWNKDPVYSYPLQATFLGAAKEKRTITIRTRPVLEDVVVYDRWLGFTPLRVQLDGLHKGIVLTASLFTVPNESPVPSKSTSPSSRLSYSDDPNHSLPPASSLPPLPADLETLLSFPQNAWRTREVEIFRWSLFPEILIFDTKDYTLQKELFHRLAFYLEKKGYRGKLQPDTRIWDLHGYNAHNYSGEGLAAFFNEAIRTKFPLNPKELWLADYLSTYGILVRQNDRYAPGKGGILSISRESSDAHRRFLLNHEAFHGVYYVSKPFQDQVASLWKELAPLERKFWIYILSWMQYDPSDPYLVVNEFQAYLLQQPLHLVDRYFKETMVQRILEKNPEMEGFFKEVFEKHPEMFSRSYLRLQGFLARELGISSTTLTTLKP